MLMGSESVVTEKTMGSGVDAEGNAIIDERLKAFLATLNTRKRAHGTLIMEGVCVRCGHCHMKLTDSVSIERGIGPVCSKRGYNEEPRDDGNATDAMIALAEYPQLVEFLLAHHDPGNLRGLMNALVKVCSLNVGNANLHAACCDAIDALGWAKLANAMRETISCMTIQASKEAPGCYDIWVKKAFWNWGWNNAVMAIPGAKKLRHASKGLYVRVPIHAADDPKRGIGGKFEGQLMSNRAALWKCMVRHFSGRCAKTPQGGVKILEKNSPKSDPPPAQ